MDGLAAACEELRILQRQFEAGASKWFNLRHVFVSWPEGTAAPTDDELPEDFRAGPTPCLGKWKDPETGEVTLWFSVTALGMSLRDNQEFRFRKGFESESCVLALPKKHRGDDADIEDECVCRERFTFLANRAVDVFGNSIGEALGISAAVMACPFKSLCQKWFLIIHEVLGITPKNLPGRRAHNEALRFEIVEDLFLDSARAIAKLLAAPRNNGGDDAAAKGVEPRNTLFKQWHADEGSDTYKSPTTIMTKWNLLKFEERKMLCPAKPGKVSLANVKNVVNRREQVRKG